MAGFSDIMVRSERRTCRVGKRRAMFHRWIQRAEVAPPDLVLGGPGGQLMECFGLVEFEDGHVEEVYPRDVIFTDGGDFLEPAIREEQK